MAAAADARDGSALTEALRDVAVAAGDARAGSATPGLGDVDRAGHGIDVDAARVVEARGDDLWRVAVAVAVAMAAAGESCRCKGQQR
jgi:hypothetical protein